MRIKILFILFAAFLSLLPAAAPDTQAQTPKPSPSSSSSNGTNTVGGYEISSTVEVGARGLEVNGLHEKFRSDFNYKPGLRLFDSSFLMEAKEGKGKAFDSLLFTTSGWNSDPTGLLRFDVEKMGMYRFDSRVRQVKHYNNLTNHANPNNQTFGWHGANTKRNFGDFDLTLFPQNQRFRVRLGASFTRTDGTAGYNTRPLSDEFPIVSNVKLRSNDFRAGVDGKLAGFKLSLTHGFRRFEDDTYYFLPAPHPGTNTTNSTRLTTFERVYPIRGNTNYTMFSVQRTFAKRLDFTGRFIYSITERDFKYLDFLSGRDSSNNFVDNEIISVSGDTKRPQSRGDIGLTYAVTDKFRISNTFSYDGFNISGGSTLTDEVFSRTAAGAARPRGFTNTTWYRMTGYKRYVNTIEGDYQFSNRFGINVGYRYTHRKVDLEGYNRTITSAVNNALELCPATVSSPNPRLFCEAEENTTNTVIFGTRIKPLKNWSIFADAEHGESDNAFVRLSNYNFTNFRVRSRWHFNQFTFNVSAIAKNNENPSTSSDILNSSGVLVLPGQEIIANTKSRIFSADVDWSPSYRFSINTGYTYHHLTSETDVIVPLAALTQGFSQYYIRDSYAFIDVSAQPVNRVSIFASYRFDKDRGQGDRVPTAPQFIISSYPYRLKMPEVRVAVRLTRNIEWNVGYQYYDYRENLQNAYPPLTAPFTTTVGATPFLAQNYSAHMPYTSLRFYFGRKER